MILSRPQLSPASASEALLPATASIPPPLRLSGIERSWGPRKVLKGIDLTIPPATVAWLGGPNGAGKTTLLRVAAGILIPDRGAVSLCGLDPERDRRAYHRRLGYLCAGDRGLYARLTVRQNLDLACRLSQIPRRDHRRLLERGIARFELHELTKRRVDRLSMGQRQRVRLAMAFIHEPALVLLDEPNTSLDDHALELVEAALVECTLRGASVLWCSPASGSLPLPANVRYLLADGKVREA
jgi:ABC-2 type transport system ATP-binding protein